MFRRIKVHKRSELCRRDLKSEVGVIKKKIKMRNLKSNENDVKELQFDSTAVRVTELEERKEMIVLWRRGDGVLPKDQTHIPDTNPYK